MNDRKYYLISFLFPFALVYLSIGLVLKFDGPGMNVARVILGSIFGLFSVAVTYLSRDGLEFPENLNKKSLILTVILGLALMFLSMPFPAGKAPGKPSSSDQLCKCLGSSFTAEATPELADMDRRKYCYGIPQSCKKVQKEDFNQSPPYN